MKHVFICLLCAILLNSPVWAADKGPYMSGPQQAAPVEQPPVAAFTGCYGEVSAGRSDFEFARLSETFSRFGLGLGCDYQFGSVIWGGFGRYDFTNDQTASLGTRLGYAFNPYLLGYGLMTYEFDGSSFSLGDGILSVGAGLETFLISDHTTLFVEGTKDMVGIGAADDLDAAWTFRLGARYRFGGGVR